MIFHGLLLLGPSRRLRSGDSATRHDFLKMAPRLPLMAFLLDDRDESDADGG